MKSLLGLAPQPEPDGSFKPSSPKAANALGELAAQTLLDHARTNGW